MKERKEERRNKEEDEMEKEEQWPEVPPGAGGTTAEPRLEAPRPVPLRELPLQYVPRAWGVLAGTRTGTEARGTARPRPESPVSPPRPAASPPARHVNHGRYYRSQHLQRQDPLHGGIKVSSSPLVFTNEK
jgi:hypothetical protein